MGRPRLSEGSIRETRKHLIWATQNLIERDGLKSITIRKIAQEAEVNSAILYKCFQDLDELILFACVDNLKDYIRELQTLRHQMKDASALEIYLTLWELFCRYSFRFPECTQHLFFGRHSGRLDNVIRSYYELFPEQLESISNQLLPMLWESRLGRRNLEMLMPVLRDTTGEEKILLINDLTVAFFQSLLNHKVAEKGQADDGILTGRMLEACRFLLSVPE